ncbi:MAG: YaiO family outer membrane beta-barrel protein [Sphingomicrobium sp.]
MSLTLALVLAAAQSPAVVAAPYDQAVAARRTGDIQAANDILRGLVAREPGNADAWVQYGYVLRALGRPAEAAAAFGKALTLAPEYKDASDGRALVRADEYANPRLALDFDAGYAFVGGGQPDWREEAVQLRFQANRGLAVTGRIEDSHRFGRDDIYGELRVDGRASDVLRLYALAGATPSADFRPQLQIGGGGSARLLSGPNPTLVTADVRWARYRAGRLSTINPGIEQYLSGGRVWLTARWINVFADGRHLGGWLGRGDFQLSPSVRLFGGAANAADLEQGLAIRTRSVFGGTVLDLGSRYVVRLTAARDSPDVGPRRTQFNIGLGLRFR